MVAQGETKPNIQKTWKQPDGFAKRVFFEKAFDFILSRVASFIRRKCLKQFSTLPPMIKRVFLSTLLLGLAFISSAAKAEKLVDFQVSDAFCLFVCGLSSSPRRWK